MQKGDNITVRNLDGPAMESLKQAVRNDDNFCSIGSSVVYWAEQMTHYTHVPKPRKGRTSQLR